MTTKTDPTPEDPLRAALESVVRLLEPIPLSVDVEQAGMQAEVAIATAREALAAPPVEVGEDAERRDAIASDRTWASGYAAGRAALRLPDPSEVPPGGSYADYLPAALRSAAPALDEVEAPDVPSGGPD